MLERMDFLSVFDWSNFLLSVGGLMCGFAAGYRLAMAMGDRDTQADTQTISALEDELFVLRNRIYEQEHPQDCKADEDEPCE